MWLIVTTMLGFMSGWFPLQQSFPDDRSEEPLLRLRARSGSMGAGVALNGVLKLRAYPSSLGVGIWRIFGPFQKPLKIAWSEIEAEQRRSFFFPMVKLRFGDPAKGTLTISASSWKRLTDAVPETDRRVRMPAAPVVSGRYLARALFLQWLAISGLGGAFFYFVSRLNGTGNGVPLALSVALPAVVVGIGQIVRYARES
jgi:hypothetical protein